MPTEWIWATVLAVPQFVLMFLAAVRSERYRREAEHLSLTGKPTGETEKRYTNWVLIALLLGCSGIGTILLLTRC